MNRTSIDGQGAKTERAARNGESFGKKTRPHDQLDIRKLARDPSATLGILLGCSFKDYPSARPSLNHGGLCKFTRLCWARCQVQSMPVGTIINGG